MPRPRYDRASILGLTDAAPGAIVVEQWKGRGNCAGLPLVESDEIFFPQIDNVTLDVENRRAATARDEFCHDCPVRAECLTEGMKSREYGIYAGTTPRQRQAMWRKGWSPDNPVPIPPVRRTPKEPKHRAECGTMRGVAEHDQHGERYCDPCRRQHHIYRAGLRAAKKAREEAGREATASTKAARERADKVPPVKRDKCGSVTGYNAHSRNFEKTCGPCKKAMSDYKAKRRNIPEELRRRTIREKAARGEAA